MTFQSDAAGLSASTPLSSSPSRPAKIIRITGVQAHMARAALGLSMAKVASAIGCTKMTLSRFENGWELSGKVLNAVRSFYESHGIQFVADAYYHSVRAPK
jgi:DNA-binding XRE family transcriptional regulator